jgi:hypothetical protein
LRSVSPVSFGGMKWSSHCFLRVVVPVADVLWRNVCWSWVPPCPGELMGTTGSPVNGISGRARVVKEFDDRGEDGVRRLLAQRGMAV